MLDPQTIEGTICEEWGREAGCGLLKGERRNVQVAGKSHHISYKSGENHDAPPNHHDCKRPKKKTTGVV